VGLQAAVSALKQFPAVNAVIDGDDIIYRDYVDISIAVGTAKVKFQTLCTFLLSLSVKYGRNQRVVLLNI
jgi:pyruvate/2-oxoglutarate dehydrogenase complex dihydrolipoamide acyltransferase (E2) component